jgi:hypothetical protein
MVVAAMRAFAAKHSKTITTAAMSALDAHVDPERGFRDALVIRLKLRPEPTLVEKMFQVTDARVYSVDEMGDRIRSQEIFDHLKGCIENCRKSGGRKAEATHGISVILLNTDFRLLDVLPVTFSAAEMHPPIDFGQDAALDWNQALLTLLNAGIILK